MVDINRAQRISDLMRKELGKLLIHEINDPRLKFISITDLHVSRDLSYAKVFYTLVDSQNESELTEKNKQEAAKSLEKASGFMRKRLAAELDLRVIPKLNFKYDDSMEHGRHITSVLNEIKSKEHKEGASDHEDS